MTIGLTEDEIENAKTALAGVKLPAIPIVVQEANAELVKADPDMTILVELVSQDPVLSGEVVKIVNSPYYGLRRKVDSVQQAIMLLGAKKLKNVLMTAAIREALPSNNDPALERFWDQSTAVATCASGLAGLVLGIPPDEAYMAGLFMDVGALVLFEKSDDYRPFLIEQGQFPLSVCDLEEETFGTDHATIGYLLGTEWQLPDDVALSILYHHTDTYEIFDSDTTRTLVGILQLAFVLISRQFDLDAEATEEQLKFKARALEELLIPEEEVENIAAEFLPSM